jgi:RNA-directed DNA polymerase
MFLRADRAILLGQSSANFNRSREVLATSLLEELLSLANFQPAWEKVAENQGSAGIDEETIADFRQNLPINLGQLRESFANSTYPAHPCKLSPI